MPDTAPAIRSVRASAYRVPTSTPEADGTLEWSATTLVVVEVEAGGATGLGYSYVHRSAAAVVDDLIAPALEGGSAFDLPRHFEAMRRAVRNAGSGGIAACAISAADAALWDLKARLLGISLAALLGARRERVPVYGSGGFTNYPDAATIEQFAGWAREHGIERMKMKVGAEPGRDPARMAAVREALPAIELMIDANGALRAREAFALASPRPPSAASASASAAASTARTR